MAGVTSKKEKISASQRTMDFIQNHRRSLLIILVIAVVAFIALSLVFIINENQKGSAINKVEELTERYDAVRGDLSNKTAEIDAITKELSDVANKGKPYSVSRAFSLMATIHVDKKEWLEAEKDYVAAAEKNTKSFQAPVALYNAAAVAEERGDIDKAIELYKKCLANYEKSFPEAPRAYFAIGRLYETKKDYTSAEKAYTTMVTSFPDDSWTKLANSRIIAIASLKGK